MTQLKFVTPYDDNDLAAAMARFQEQKASDKAQGLEPEMPEHEARALLEQYFDAVLEANEAMACRGISKADFPIMFNEFLRRFDAMSPTPEVQQ